MDWFIYYKDSLRKSHEIGKHQREEWIGREIPLGKGAAFTSHLHLPSTF